jgi:TPR repeat protein
MAAAKMFRKAAEQGDVESRREIAICYQDGKGVLQDLQQAFAWFHKGATDGDVECQFRLGKCYCNGDGVPKDSKLAARWLEKASNQGHSMAQAMLSSLYCDGIGVVKNFSTAASWAIKSAHQNDPLGLLASTRRGRVEQNSNTSLSLLLRTAKMGDEKAMDIVAYCYMRGEQGHGDNTSSSQPPVWKGLVNKDWFQAAVWFQRRMDSSCEKRNFADADSAFQLAKLYLEGGHGLCQDIRLVRGSDYLNLVYSIHCQRTYLFFAPRILNSKP